VQAPGEPLGLLGRRASLLVAARQRQNHRSGRDRLDRLRDQPGALADVERLHQLGLGPREVAALAQRDREPVQRGEGDFRPPDLLAELVGPPEVRRRVIPVALAPAQHPAHHVREAELAVESLALRQPGARGRQLFPLGGK
jgi:hypothetical protein